jgi:hypothetical protein
VKESEERNSQTKLYCQTNICIGAQQVEHIDAMVEIHSELLTMESLEECLVNQLILTKLDLLTLTFALLPTPILIIKHPAKQLGTGQAQLNLQLPTLLHTCFNDL